MDPEPSFSEISGVRAEGGVALWTGRDQRGAGREFRLTAPFPGAWRLEMSGPGGGFAARGAAQEIAADLGEDLEVGPAPVQAAPAGDGAWRLTAPGSAGCALLSARPPALAFSGPDGRCRGAVGAISAGAGSLRVSGPLAAGERLYGTGERFDAADQRGRRVTIWAEDRWCQTEGNSYLPIPFVLSSAGYGLLVNRFEGLVLDLGAADPDRWAFELGAAPLDLYVFVADSPREILGALARLTGRAPVPPEWAFGVLVCRHLKLREFATAAGIREMARRMDAADLPWSATIIEGWPTYDARTWEELRQVVAELHGRGKKVLVYERCGRVEREAFETLGARPEHCVRAPDGAVDLREASTFNPEDAPDAGTSRFLDLTNPEAVRWWTEEVWGRLLDEVGIDGAKIDFCEQFPEHVPYVLRDGRGPEGRHHHFAVWYNAMMYRLYQRRRPEGGLCFSRGGGLGAQRYPFVWCGDQLREFRFLRPILTAALSAGLSGVPLVAHDLGAYLPAREPAGNPEPEVFARGVELACFSPTMQTHGKVTRPYDFEPPVVDLYRRYSRLHYALVPYLVEQTRAGNAAGLPLMRHLFLHFPGDERARLVEDQYFLGEDLLVAPVLERADARSVYLPAGSWRDLNSNELIAGPRDIPGYPAPLARIPVFAAERPTSRALGGILAEVRELLAAAGRALPGNSP